MPPHAGLVHTQEYDWRNSNVSLINSSIDHNLKYQSAATEPAWNNSAIGVSPGLFIWRIEDFEVVSWPKEKCGSFYEGDSYIVLCSESVKTETGREDELVLVHDIFFWLGRYTSQDEAGTAAYKAVELDEFLRGEARQYREVQTAPSDAFLGLFPRIKILRGGVRSGFTHVDTNEVPENIDTLLRIFKHPGQTAGRDSIVVHEVELSWESLDEEDVFILDRGDTVFVWQGKGCSPMEKLKAAQVVNDVTLAKHVDVEVLSQTEARAKVVVDYLGGQDVDYFSTQFHCQRPVSTASQREVKKLFRLSDAGGDILFDLVKEGNGIGKEDLDGGDIFLLDAGKSIWVWEGGEASRAEKAMWLRVAQSYIGGQQDAAELSVAKVKQGNEGRAFWTAVEA